MITFLNNFFKHAMSTIVILFAAIEAVSIF